LRYQKKIEMKKDSLIIVVVILVVLIYIVSSCEPKPPKPEPPELKPVPTSVTDIDNNKYQIKRFGNTLWMTENLRVTRYDTASSRKGIILSEPVNNDPSILNLPYFTDVRNYKESPYYEESPYTDNLTDEIINSLGLLYNWCAATGFEDNSASVGDKTKVQGICPNGWRLPRTEDWESLFNYLGGKEIAGEKLKSMYGWYTLSGSGTNESGMNCYPAGNAAGSIITSVGTQTWFWNSKSQTVTITKAETLELFYDNKSAELKNIYKFNANSVRCILDLDSTYAIQ